MKKYKQKHNGFTLIELLVVISIIGILSTLAVVSLNNARVKARDAKRVADLRQVLTALELYASDNDGYPAATNLVLGEGTALSLSKNSGFSATPSGTVYMGKVPANPSPGGSDYRYSSYTSPEATTACNIGPCTWFNITFSIEEQTGGYSAGVHIANPNGML